MTPEALIAQYGYPALAVGLMLEGETVLVLGAFLAHRGYLSLAAVLAIGLVVTFGSDQFFFWLGRRHGGRILARRPGWKEKVEKARSRLGGNSALLFVGFRFLYGLRTVMPFVFGMSGYDPLRFALFNALGAAAWTLIFGMAGYAFGQIVEVIIADVGRYEGWIALGIAAAGAAGWLARRRRARQTGGKAR